jgi:hypothetical protein
MKPPRMTPDQKTEEMKTDPVFICLGLIRVLRGL